MGQHTKCKFQMLEIRIQVIYVTLKVHKKCVYKKNVTYTNSKIKLAQGPTINCVFIFYMSTKKKFIP